MHICDQDYCNIPRVKYNKVVTGKWELPILSVEHQLIMGVSWQSQRGLTILHAYLKQKALASRHPYNLQNLQHSLYFAKGVQ